MVTQEKVGGRVGWRIRGDVGGGGRSGVAVEDAGRVD
jgi:hypothetical protein